MKKIYNDNQKQIEMYNEVFEHPKEVIFKGPRKIITGIMYGEEPLTDDFPVHIGIRYVIDDEGGKVIISEMNGTIGKLKKILKHKGYNAATVRNCKVNARNLF